MAVPAVSVYEATTQDAAPTSAPFKVSHLRTYMSIVFSVDVPFGIGGLPQFVQIVRGGTNRKNYDDVYLRQGIICGMGQRCGYENGPPPGGGRRIRMRPLQVGSPSYTFGVTFPDYDDELPAAEGNYNIRCWARNDDGWST